MHTVDASVHSLVVELNPLVQASKNQPTNLRTDLDVFNMACGYQMAKESFDHNRSEVWGFATAPTQPHRWIFSQSIDMICGKNSNDAQACLNTLSKGSKINLFPSDYYAKQINSFTSSLLKK
jgi:hypothetical protein